MSGPADASDRDGLFSGTSDLWESMSGSPHVTATCEPDRPPSDAIPRRSWHNLMRPKLADEEACSPGGQLSPLARFSQPLTSSWRRLWRPVA